jgi:hypothetical protein
MDHARKNRYHSNDSSPIDEDVSSYLSPFLRSSRSPSYLEVKTQPKPFERAIASEEGRDRGEIDEMQRHYECIEKVLNDENTNLKLQTKYLVSEMRKSLKREKHHKEELLHTNTLYLRTKQRLA